MKNNKITISKTLHHNRFSYLLQDKQLESSQKKDKEFNQKDFLSCLLKPCANQIYQHELAHQSINQPKRKITKIQLQSINFDIFKQKIQQKSSINSFAVRTPSRESLKVNQQNSSMSSFIVYTPSKEQEKKHFDSNNHEVFTLQFPKANQIHTQRYSNKNTQNNTEQKNYSDIYLSKNQQQLSSITNSFQEESINQHLNEFIKLQISESDQSSFQFDSIKKYHKTTMAQFQTWEKTENSHQGCNKSARLPTFQSSLHKTNQDKDTSINFGSSEKNFSENNFGERPLSQTLAIRKTKEMSNMLYQSSGLYFQDSVSLLQVNQTVEPPKNMLKSIKLKGKKSKKG